MKKKGILRLEIPHDQNELNLSVVRKRTSFDCYTDRRPKRFLTSKHEEDKHDNISACPSIEKDLQELSIIGPNRFPTEDTSNLIDQLWEENKLKDEAIKKLQSIIELLRDENNQLNSQVQNLKQTLKEKDKTILQLEDTRINSSQDPILTKELFTERNKRNSKTVVLTPRDGIVKTEFLFDLGLSKDREVHRSQDKIVNSDHPTFKDISSQIGISKKLTPYSSRISLKNESPKSIPGAEALTKMGILIINQQIERNKAMINQLEQTIQIEQEQLQEMINNIREIDLEELEEIQERFETLGAEENISKNLFASSQKNNFQADGITTHQILKHYQEIIERYRIYSAYLKSYLCEALNALSYQGPKSNIDIHLLQSFIKSGVHEVSSRQKSRLFALLKENKELKSIVQGLITNIEKSRRGESISIHAWSEYGMSDFP